MIDHLSSMKVIIGTSCTRGIAYVYFLFTKMPNKNVASHDFLG